nr:hypothetical protein [Tanacetum cinerariifolium]
KNTTSVNLGRLLPHERGLKFESLHGGFHLMWESVGFCIIDASIRGWQGLPSGWIESLIIIQRLQGLPSSSKEVPSVYELEPQPLPNFLSLDVNREDKKGTDLPIKPYSPDSFRMKVVDNLTIHTPPSPHVAHFHLKGQSRSLDVNFLNLEMIEDDWKLKSKEVSFLGRGFNLPVKPKK